MKKEQAILAALAFGDSKVIRRIYTTNFPKVRAFVLQNKGQLADAEDVFQKALLQLAVRYKENPFEIKTTFEGYLFTVCKNLWRRTLNKEKNRVTNDGTIELVDENTDNACALLEQERWELLQDKLKQLSNNCQEVLKLFFAKVSYAVMVVQLVYSSETVARQRVFKCKKRLTELIKQDTRYQTLKEL